MTISIDLRHVRDEEVDRGEAEVMVHIKKRCGDGASIVTVWNSPAVRLINMP